MPGVSNILELIFVALKPKLVQENNSMFGQCESEEILGPSVPESPYGTPDLKPPQKQNNNGGKSPRRDSETLSIKKGIINTNDPICVDRRQVYDMIFQG